MLKKKVILITGATSGIGLTCANYLSSLGHKVYGTGRNPSLKNYKFNMIKMDVTDDKSVQSALDGLIEQEGQLDVLINNAGIGIAGSIEDTSIKEAKQQFETNFFGNVRLTQKVLPFMRKKNSGHIINISSIGGVISLPFQGFYCASKFAIEGLTESLKYEVKKYGIKVCLIQPGDFKTGFTQNRILSEKSKDSIYKDQMNVSLSIMEGDEQAGPTPEIIAKKINKIISSNIPKLRNPVGMIIQKFAIILKKVLPQLFFEWIIRQTYKI
jgi:short-subunit dehydrogenase